MEKGREFDSDEAPPKQWDLKLFSQKNIRKGEGRQ